MNCSRSAGLWVSKLAVTALSLPARIRRNPPARPPQGEAVPDAAAAADAQRIPDADPAADGDGTANRHRLADADGVSCGQPARQAEEVARCERVAERDQVAQSGHAPDTDKAESRQPVALFDEAQYAASSRNFAVIVSGLGR